MAAEGKPKKVATKGAKQIVEENVATLAFYRNMVVGSSILAFSITWMFFQFTTLTIVMYIVCGTIFFASYRFMEYMSRAKYSNEGQLLDSGVDLNMIGGVGEHIKDLIILTSGSILLSLTTNYFWLLLLLAPIRAFMLLWANVLQPYFFQQQPPVNAEAEDKKQKKLERRMKRQANFR